MIGAHPSSPELCMSFNIHCVWEQNKVNTSAIRKAVYCTGTDLHTVLQFCLPCLRFILLPQILKCAGVGYNLNFSSIGIWLQKSMLSRWSSFTCNTQTGLLVKSTQLMSKLKIKVLDQRIKIQSLISFSFLITKVLLTTPELVRNTKSLQVIFLCTESSCRKQT